MSRYAYQTNKSGLLNVIVMSSLVALGLNFWQFALAADGSQNAFVLPSTSPKASPAAAPANPSAAATTLPGGPAGPATPSPAVATAAAKLSAAGLKPGYAELYLAASARTGTPWQLLAAVHQVETGQSPSTNRASYAGAVGPMQFMPATFRAWSLDGDGNGTKDITNVTDAVYSAGRYLAAGGADKGKYTSALYIYNHSNAYVSKVMGIARKLGL